MFEITGHIKTAGDLKLGSSKRDKILKGSVPIDGLQSLAVSRGKRRESRRLIVWTSLQGEYRAPPRKWNSCRLLRSRWDDWAQSLDIYIERLAKITPYINVIKCVQANSFTLKSPLYNFEDEISTDVLASKILMSFLLIAIKIKFEK